MSSTPDLCRAYLSMTYSKEIVMKLKVLAFAFAAFLALSLSAQAATVFTCCDNPACCDGSGCCK